MEKQQIGSQVETVETPEEGAIKAVIAFNALVGVVRSDSPEFEKASIDMGNALSLIDARTQSSIFEAARLKQDQQEVA